MRIVFSFLLSCLCVTPAVADPFFNFTATNIQLLRGLNYEFGNPERTLITVEHANGWTYGDNYMFVDYSMPDEGKPFYYGEFSPRLSLSKMTGHDFSYGIVKDVLISTTLEKPKGLGPRYLYGGAVDLNLPGFRFFKANAYIRDDTQLDGDTWQVTLAWNKPFQFHGYDFLIEGFADFAGGEGPTKTNNQLIVPRFLADVSPAFNLPNGKLWAGIEYSYWHNKFGNDGTTESNPQLQLKWNF